MPLSPSSFDAASTPGAGLEVPFPNPRAAEVAATAAGELKYVTIVRSDLVASTDLVAELDPEAAVLRLAPALAVMRSAVRHLGGFVCRELGDGILAVFGAPLADDNHAVSGVYAALDLVRRVAILGDPGFQVRVGVHTGWVIAHTVRTEFSSAYEVGGPALHLIERLQAVAQPGTVCVSEACRNLSDGHVAYTRLPAQRLKGFPQPVALYRADRTGEASKWRVRAGRGMSPFVGRKHEFALLVQAAADVERGSERTVALVGEPGIGKSRLAREFVASLARAGWKLIDVECSSIARTSPYALLKSLLLSMFAQDPAADPRTRQADVSGAANGFLPLWCSALDAVLDLPVADRAWTELQPAARRSAIADACRAVFRRTTAGARTVLLIEDLHWIDGASGEILEDLRAAGFAHPFLFLFTTRPSSARALGRLAGVQVVLRPLDAEAGETLLATLLAGSAIAPALRARILRHTGHVPLFMEEVCKRLTEAVSAAGAGSVAASALVDLGVPPTVQGVIATRIDGLNGPVRNVLQLASTIGASGSIALLAALTEEPPAVFLQRIGALDDAGLLRETSARSDQSFEFPHELVRQVAYESMLESTRAAIHRRILAALEADAGAGPEDRSSLLCHHARHAKDWRKTIDYACRVARKCMARSALSDASEKFGLAMTAADQLPPSVAREQEAIDLRIEARSAFSASGRVDRWLQLAREAEHRAAAIADTPRQVAAISVRSAALNFYGAARDAVREGELALRHAEKLGDGGWITYTQYGLGQAYFIAGRYRDAERALGRSYSRLAGTQPKAIAGTTAQDMLLLCCMMKSIAHVNRGNLRLADACQRQAQHLAARSKRPFDRVAAAYASGIYLLGAGKVRAAQARLAEALALAEQHGIRLFVPVIACQLGIACSVRGRTREARRVLLEARAQAQAVGHVSGVLRACAYLAPVLGRSGKRPAGLRLARTSRRDARRLGFAGIQAEALLLEAQMLANGAAGAVDARAWRLRRSMALARRGGARPLAARSRELLARLRAAATRPVTKS